jgi:hypothetical protein
MVKQPAPDRQLRVRFSPCPFFKCNPNIYKFVFLLFGMVKKDVMGKKKMTRSEMDEMLIENFINLQKVLTNLSVKFEDLSSNMSKMLQLFEISAKSFAEKYSEKDLGNLPSSDKEFLKKLDSLLDQNKTISKGIMMMEERVRNRSRAPYPGHGPRPSVIPRR